MVKFTVDQLRELMDKKHNIRNLSVIAHVDHGKSTLTEALVKSNEIVGVTDGRKDEQTRGITIKATGVSLHYDLPEAITKPSKAEGREFLVNLIDSPGHVDFSSEVTAALRLTDGALVLVDCVEGCRVQTETVLQQALKERIKPVVVINKIDRAFTELQLSTEEMYQKFATTIADVNKIISKYPDDVLGDCQVFPERGTVTFCAGKQGWAFSLSQFGRIYADKFKLTPEEMTKKLWGDNYFDLETKEWTDNPISKKGKKLTRSFCKFILEPISQIFNACQKNDLETLDQYLGKLGITLKNEQRELKDKELLKVVMQRWLPASEAVLEMIVSHLPSPADAQKYRMEILYTGPLDDETARSIRECDPKGPLVMFVSKMVPANKQRTRYYAFGRIFSGTISSSQKVFIMGSNYTKGSKDDLFTNKPIQRTCIMMGRKAEPVTSVPCGNTCAVAGIDNYLAKSGTITTEAESCPLVNMKYKVSPVVRAAVEPKNPVDLPKLVDALRLLSKGDPGIVCSVETTGEHIVACAGQLHMDISISDLRELMGDAEIVVGPPMVSFMETVSGASELSLAKSPNHHNRLYAVARPLEEGLPEDIEEGTISAKDEPKERARKLVEKYQWDPTEARKIWTFDSTNILIDSTKGIQYMNEIRDSVEAGFKWVAHEGVLANEPMRGIRFAIVDANLHPDAIHRGPGQILPTARRVFYASQLQAKPRLLEPIYLVEIQCNAESVSGVFNILSQRRGTILEVTDTMVKAHLPVMQSFDFTEALRGATSGGAFPQCTFSHWKMMPDDPLDPQNTKIREIISGVRTRKGESPEIPPLDRFLDKL